MELREYCLRDKSTVLCRQLSPEELHEKLGRGCVADTILDRITNNFYTSFFENSQRKLQKDINHSPLWLAQTTADQLFPKKWTSKSAVFTLFLQIIKDVIH